MNRRLREISSGFEPAFWIANTTEIFERLSYYAVFSSLALYLNKVLAFPASQAAGLSGIFGGAVWVMAIFGGAFADRIGFRRALSTAYFILACAYFLVGSIGAPWLAPLRSVVPLGLLAGIILFLPALGVALVKPSVVGTTAHASKDHARSIGYAIYYTMVNVGATAGPFVAGWMHSRLPAQAVFLVAASSVFAMFFVVLIFYREPRAAMREGPARTRDAASGLLTVLSNGRFMLFVLLFSGYWIVYWQQFLILPIYIHDYVSAKANTAYILITDPAIVITCTVIVSALTRRLASFRTILAGCAISSLAWLFIAFKASVLTAVVSLVFVAIGEITMSPRYYEYVSRLAPMDRQGTYMGFSFLPIGIGSIVGGWFGGLLLHRLGEVAHQPARIWLVLTMFGLATTALLWGYDRMTAIGPARDPAPNEAA